MGAVASSIMDIVERTALGDTAPVSIGAVATDAMVSAADERPDVPETPEKFNEPPIGLVRDDDRYASPIVGRYRHDTLVEGRTPP